MDRAIDQVVSARLPIAAVRVPFKVRPCGTSSGQMIFPVLIPPTAPDELIVLSPEVL
jgi:hypothetical protein